MSNGHNENEPHIHEKGTLDGFGSGNCILCSVSTSDCHCSEPTAKYLKLKNQVTEDDDNFVRVLSENIPTGIVTSEKATVPDLNCSTSGDSENQPPGFSMSCKEFLSFICQHKIPAVA